MKELFKFLKELRDNNNREWFIANKERYGALHKEYIGVVEKLIEGVSTFEPEIAGLEAKSCVYRIYRDIRFSNDKTPYKTHFGAYMTGFGGRTSPYGGYYLHIEPDNSLVSGGVWCPDPKMLKKLRKDIYDNMEEFIGILENKEFKKVYGELEKGEMLKRMPDGFPKDYDNDILKRKYFVVTSPKPEEFFYSNGWIDEVIENYRVLSPFNRFLNYTMGDFFGKV